jgi:formamidopyrimidine-DNA glycosylase
MSGSLRVIDCSIKPDKHDHVDFVFRNGKCLRLKDPRRFGAVLFTSKDPCQHKLLKDLGPEPLEKELNGDYLFNKSRKRSVNIKAFIMDSKVVVGVGNIYASESLFKAGIHPKKAAGKVSRESYVKLARAIKSVLRASIKAGGTTLRDFTKSDGQPGYFSQKLNVYGHKGEPCPKCGKAITQSVIAQRATYYCTHCQN